MAKFIQYSIKTGTKTVETTINISALNTMVYDDESKMITLTLNTGEVFSFPNQKFYNDSSYENIQTILKNADKYKDGLYTIPGSI